MVTHEWMVKGTRQTEWIDRRGILLWLAFYVGGLGGGLFLVSLFFNNLWGMAFGWLLAAVFKGALNFSDLGKPSRVWRLILNPRSSWLSRGLLFVLSFGVFGFLTIAVSYFLPETTLAILVLKIISGIFAVGVMTYSGFVLNKVKGIPNWGLSMLPVLFVSCSLLGGFGLISIISSLTQSINPSVLEAVGRSLLFTNTLLIALYLVITLRKDPTGKNSVLYQLKGDIAWIFWTGLTLTGIAIIMAFIFPGDLPVPASVPLFVAVASEVVSCMLITYCVLKSAIYIPLMSQKSRLSRA
jgi:formate-dependent nitrite reductase membrane component NrfD